MNAPPVDGLELEGPGVLIRTVESGDGVNFPVVGDECEVSV